MATIRGFQGKFNEGYVKHRIIGHPLDVLFKNTFSFNQLLLLGALIQLAILSLLPTKFALLPTLLLLLHALVTTTLALSSPTRNPFARGTVPGKTSAQLPTPSYNPTTTTPFGTAPAAHGIVVLHLGVRFSHPLGVLGPGGSALGKHYDACNRRVLDRAAGFGCLGASGWSGTDAASHNTLLTVFYFRDVAGLHAFAHDSVHREAWEWYRKEFVAAGATHIGVFHEVFYAAPGAYETVYMNMPPTLMGRGNGVSRNEETGEEESHRMLVDAEVPELRSQWRRMGKLVGEHEGAYYEESVKAGA